MSKDKRFTSAIDIMKDVIDDDPEFIEELEQQIKESDRLRASIRVDVINDGDCFDVRVGSKQFYLPLREDSNMSAYYVHNFVFDILNQCKDEG